MKLSKLYQYSLITFFVIGTFILPVFLNGQNLSPVLKTSTQEYSVLGKGYLHYDFGSKDFVKTVDNKVSFSRGMMTSLWLGAVDPNLNLMASASTYGLGNSDFSPGILDSGGDPVLGSIEFFNKVWIIHDYEVLDLKWRYINGDLTINDIPEDILTWPAKGNPHVDSKFVENDLAPFRDKNFDGIYNPMDGDYPEAAEGYLDFIASSFAFSVYNDNSGDHPFINANPLKVEIHQLQYVINCNDHDLSNTVFTDLSIINRGSDDLRDLKVGIHIDSDLGCYTNDMFGVDTISNSVYFYNESGSEMNGCQYGMNGVGSGNIALRSIFFRQNLLSVLPLYGYASPTGTYNGNHLHSMLLGDFEYGKPMTFGGNGYNPNSTDVVKFPFVDFPNQEEGWSMQTADLDDDSKEFNVLATLGTEYILPNSKYTIHMSDVTMVWDEPIGHDVFLEYRSRIDSIEHHEGVVISDHSDCPEIMLCVEDCVWPGDANLNGRVEASDYLYIKAVGNLYDHVIPRHLITYSWYPQSSNNSGIEVGDIKIQHADVDGNGDIDNGDLRIIQESNYGFFNDSYVREVIIPEYDEYGLDVIFYENEINAGGSSIDRIAIGNVMCGKDGFFRDSIIGISYEIVWDLRFLKLSSFTPGNDEVFDRTESHFEYFDEYNDVFGVDYDKVKRIEVAKYFNFDDQIIKSGSLGPRSWEAKSGLETNNPDGRDTTYIKFQNILALNKNGDKIPIGVKRDIPVFIRNLVYNPSLAIEQENLEEFHIAPNPTVDGSIRFSLPIKYCELLSIDGKLLSSQTFDQPVKEHRLEVDEMGVYFVKCILGNGDYQIKKLVFSQ